MQLDLDRAARHDLAIFRSDSENWRDDRVFCRGCVNLTPVGSCLAPARAVASEKPDPGRPLRYLGFVPRKEIDDKRTGAQRWRHGWSRCCRPDSRHRVPLRDSILVVASLVQPQIKRRREEARRHQRAQQRLEQSGCSRALSIGCARLVRRPDGACVRSW
jgi:hypothetical protein